LDALLHLTRNSQNPGNFIDSCRVAVSYRQERIRKSATESFGRKPSKPAGAENSYQPGRENVLE